MRANSILAPSIAVTMAGAIWGTYWIPIRRLDEIGMTAAWSSFIALGVTALIFVILFIKQWMATRRLPWNIIITGLLTGMCIIFYAVSLTLTEVIKTVLLFYLTPVWSTFIDHLFLQQRISRYRIIAVISGLTGLTVILGINDGMPKISNLGDCLALLSGLLWSVAMLRINVDRQAAVWEQVGAFYIGGTIFAALFIVLPLADRATVPSMMTIKAALFWLLVFIAAYLPSMYMIFWGAQRLTPARVGILLMTEIVFGVATAALLSGEPFGWKEMIGVTLILSAAVIDVSDRYSKARGTHEQKMTNRSETVGSDN